MVLSCQGPLNANNQFKIFLVTMNSTTVLVNNYYDISRGLPIKVYVILNVCINYIR
jgi:hypothetical protein